MSTQTMLEEIMQPHTTLRPLGRKIFDALEKQQVPVKVLPGTTAFTLGDIIIQSPYREDTCICYPGSNDIAQLEYVRTLLGGVRRDLHTQKMVELAKLPAKRAEESKNLDVPPFLQRRSEEQQIRRIRVEIDKYRDDYDNASETSDTPHWGLPPPQEEDELLLEDQGPAEPMATEKNEEDEDEEAEKVEKDEEDEENKERDFRDSKLLPMEDLQLAVSKDGER